ncbi:MAG: phosphoribosylaminoimidazolesuccinocarboxamide synthase [Acidobacteria bacterium]|nr:phosphoribosylaminoimidazolesuccinocarboxamide synthase [Acidobacteriota bacterium]
MSPLVQSHLPSLPAPYRGKVRDVYDLGDDRLLIIASDRISAFDHVLGSGIPGKGRVLTQLSLFWFDFLKDFVPNHLIATEVDDYPAPLREYRDQLEGRSMLVHKAKMVEVECVARGYISGSGWKDYRATQAICGIPLPSGLLESSALPEPIFTPASKAQGGAHDENISFETVVKDVGPELATQLRDLTLAIYRKASDYAATRGLILADTKFEFGFVNGQLVLADEVLTPDSSRYWPADQYAPGGAQPSFDKQFVRDYLESIHWNKQAPAPALPDDVVERTIAKYREAYRLLTGRDCA